VATGPLSVVSVQVCFSPNFGARILPAHPTVLNEIYLKPSNQNYISNGSGLVRFGSESYEKWLDK
jgi:hypothetical protein